MATATAGKTDALAQCSRMPVPAMEPLASFQGMDFRKKFTMQNMKFKTGYWNGILCKLHSNAADYADRLQTLVIQEDYWLRNDNLGDVIGYWETATEVLRLGGSHVEHLSIRFQHNRGKHVLRIGSRGARYALFCAILEHCGSLKSLQVVGSGFDGRDVEEDGTMGKVLESLSSLKLVWLEVGLKLSESGLFGFIGMKLIDGANLATLNVVWTQLDPSLWNHKLPNVRRLTLMRFGWGDRSPHSDHTLTEFLRIFSGVRELSLFDFVAGSQLNLAWILNGIMKKMSLVKLNLDRSVSSMQDASDEAGVETLQMLSLEMSGYLSLAGRLNCLKSFKPPKALILVFDNSVEENIKDAVHREILGIYPTPPPMSFQIEPEFDPEIADQMAMLNMI